LLPVIAENLRINGVRGGALLPFLPCDLDSDTAGGPWTGR